MKARFQSHLAAMQFLAAFLFTATLCRAQTEAAQPATEPVRKGVVTASVLNVRARPAKHFERIGQFAQGDDVKVVGETAEWYEVCVPPDTRAWIASQFVTDDGLITGDDVRIHSGPGLVFTTFGRVHKGDTVGFMGPPVDGWQQIRAPQDATAWVSKAYVRVEQPPEPPAQDETPQVAAENKTTEEDTVNSAEKQTEETVEKAAQDVETLTVNTGEAPAREPVDRSAEVTPEQTQKPTTDRAQKQETETVAVETPAETNTETAPKQQKLPAENDRDNIALPTKDWKKVTLLPREQSTAETAPLNAANQPTATDDAPRAKTPAEETRAAENAEATAEEKPPAEAAEKTEETQTVAVKTSEKAHESETDRTDLHADGKTETEKTPAEQTETPAAEETENTVAEQTETPDLTVAKSPEQDGRKPPEPDSDEQETQQADQTATTPPESQQDDVDPTAEPALQAETAPSATSSLIMREGLLLPLGDQASEQATHVLCLRVQYTAFPLCYLRSSRINLTDWERREVRVYGRQQLYPGWEKPVIVVTSIQIKQGE
jgi:uncharacterized protein YgiM (DUF1202 family)